MNVLKILCEKCENDLCKEDKCKAYYDVAKYLHDKELLNDKQKKYLQSIYINEPELFISEFYQIMKLNKNDDKLLKRLNTFKSIDFNNSLYLVIAEELLKYLC